MSDPTLLKQISVTIESTGRSFGLAVPYDLSGDELLEMIAWMASPGGLRATLVPPGKIITPARFQRPIS